MVQRYRCIRCGKTFSESQPLDGVKIETAKVVQITHLLVEGVGIRAIERLTGVHRDTVLSVLETVGQKCADLMDKRVQNVEFKCVQVDEMFSFVRFNERKNFLKSRELDDQYTFIGIDSDTK